MVANILCGLGAVERGTSGVMEVGVASFGGSEVDAILGDDFAFVFRAVVLASGGWDFLIVRLGRTSRPIGSVLLNNEAGLCRLLSEQGLLLADFSMC